MLSYRRAQLEVHDRSGMIGGEGDIVVLDLALVWTQTPTVFGLAALVALAALAPLPAPVPVVPALPPHADSVRP
jgi:hypothetical protein